MISNASADVGGTLALYDVPLLNLTKQRYVMASNSHAKTTHRAFVPQEIVLVSKDVAALPWNSHPQPVQLRPLVTAPNTSVLTQRCL